MKTNHSATLGLVYAALLTQTGCQHDNAGAPEPKKPKLVFITSGNDSFWRAAAAGIEAAASDFKAEFTMLEASSNLTDPLSLSAELLREVDGAALSPVNGVVQLTASGGRTCWLGVDHYKEGRKAGAFIREALTPENKILILYQTPPSDVAQARRQGILDELFESQFFIHEATHETVRNPDAGVVVALSGRDLGVCLELLCDETKIIAFEDNAVTRSGLAAGQVYAVVAAQPYQYGYHAVRVLAGLARGDASVLPKDGFLNLPLAVLRGETASQVASRALHSGYDSTLFPRANAGNLDRATQTGDLVADRTARHRGALR